MSIIPGRARSPGFSYLETMKIRTENTKSERKTVRIFSKALIINANCGEDEIRTRGTLETYVGLANRWFQPLTHLSRGTVPKGFVKPFRLIRTAKIQK